MLRQEKQQLWDSVYLTTSCTTISWPYIKLIPRHLLLSPSHSGWCFLLPTSPLPTGPYFIHARLMQAATAAVCLATATPHPEQVCPSILSLSSSHPLGDAPWASQQVYHAGRSTQQSWAPWPLRLLCTTHHRLQKEVSLTHTGSSTSLGVLMHIFRGQLGCVSTS